MKHYKYKIVAFCAVIIFTVPWLINKYPRSIDFIDSIFSYIDNNYATVFLRDSVTVNQLKNKYENVSNGKPRIKILLVPGHEPSFGGTEYKNLKERELNTELVLSLEDFLKRNGHYEVIVTRNNNSWNKVFQDFFSSNWDSIISFFKENKDEMSRLVNNGEVSKIVNGISHNSAPQSVALRLYGINKWANDNDIDIVLHIHFNDYPRNNIKAEGNYSGFSIYVPEKQYSNSTTTRVIADSIFKRLAKYNAISDLPKEKAGITEDQDLIAIGSYNTLDAPSMLIEYGYIYESQFVDKDTRDIILKDFAFQTYLGIQDFFGGSNDISLVYDTLVLPYSWKNNLSKNSNYKEDILALQTSFIIEGIYSGNGEIDNECPRTGKFGKCTASALNKFQQKYGIKGETGIVGEQTRNILNNRYSLRLNNL